MSVCDIFCDSVTGAMTGQDEESPDRDREGCENVKTGGRKKFAPARGPTPRSPTDVQQRWR